MVKEQKVSHLSKEYAKVLEGEGFVLKKTLGAYVHRESGMIFVFNPNLDPRAFSLTVSNIMSHDEPRYRYEARVGIPNLLEKPFTSEEFRSVTRKILATFNYLNYDAKKSELSCDLKIEYSLSGRRKQI